MRKIWFEVGLRGPKGYADGRLESAWGEEGRIWDVLEVSSETGPDARLLGGSVHGHKYEVSLPDGLVDVGREEEVAAACLTDDLLEARLVDWELEVGAVPRIDAGLVEVDDGDLDVRTLEGDDGTRWATWEG